MAPYERGGSAASYNIKEQSYMQGPRQVGRNAAVILPILCAVLGLAIFTLLAACDSTPLPEATPIISASNTPAPTATLEPSTPTEVQQAPTPTAEQPSPTVGAAT